MTRQSGITANPISQYRKRPTLVRSTMDATIQKRDRYLTCRYYPQGGSRTGELDGSSIFILVRCSQDRIRTCNHSPQRELNANQLRHLTMLRMRSPLCCRDDIITLLTHIPFSREQHNVWTFKTHLWEVRKLHSMFFAYSGRDSNSHTFRH